MPGGRTRVVMPVRSERWLARLLLRLGADASVVRPTQWQHLAADRARQVLGLYDT